MGSLATASAALASSAGAVGGARGVAASAAARSGSLGTRGEALASDGTGSASSVAAFREAGAGGGREGRAGRAASALAGGGLDRRGGTGGGTDGRDAAALSLLAPRAELGADAAALEDGIGDSERRRRLLSQTGVKKPERRSNSPTSKLFEGLADSVSRSSVVIVVLASCSTGSCVGSQRRPLEAVGCRERQLPERGFESSRQVVRLEPSPAAIQPCVQALYSVSS
jgi:hypothetical protein